MLAIVRKPTHQSTYWSESIVGGDWQWSPINTHRLPRNNANQQAISNAYKNNSAFDAPCGMFSTPKLEKQQLGNVKKTIIQNLALPEIVEFIRSGASSTVINDRSQTETLASQNTCTHLSTFWGTHLRGPSRWQEVSVATTTRADLSSRPKLSFSRVCTSRHRVFQRVASTDTRAIWSRRAQMSLKAKRKTR